MKRLLLPAAALIAACAFLGGQFASASGSQDKAKGKPAAATTEASVIATQLPSYPKMTCPVSGEELGGEMGDPIDLVYEGRLIRVCCKGCVKKVAADPAAMIAKVNAAVISEQSASYPLMTCTMSGDPVAKTSDYVHGTRLVRFCCDRCKTKFIADPAPTMAKVDAALIAAQVKNYKVEACPVSGEKLGSMGEPIDMLYGTKLVRLCCKGCVKSFNKDGAAVLAKVDALAAAAK